MSDDDIRNRLRVGKKHQQQDGVESLFKIWSDQRKMQAEDKRIEAEIRASKRKAKELKKKLRQHKLGTGQTFSEKLRPKLPSREGLMRFKYIFALFLVAVGLFLLNQSQSKTTNTLGDSTESTSSQVELPREDPEFELLFPVGVDPARYDVVRISPPGTEPSYTYLDRFTDDGPIFRVTQQEIPDGFDLTKTATDFQATSIIQVDDITVYHGYSEKGGIQSLIFNKNNKLISIRSPQKFSDDVWASYVVALQ